MLVSAPTTAASTASTYGAADTGADLLWLAGQDEPAPTVFADP
jgi:hypothetical protein